MILSEEEHAVGASEIVEQYEQTWKNKDSAGMVACYAPGGTYNAPGADHLTGAAIGEFAEMFMTAFPDYVYTWKVVAASADAVAADWVFESGPMKGELMGIAPTGGSSVARGAHTIRLAGDKIASVEAYWDNQSFLTELGVKLG
jgi:predicted ester cyclase